jgi:hypothetical protein
MGEDRGVSQALAQGRLDLLDDVVSALHGPRARDKDVQRHEGTGTGLPGAQRMEPDAVVLELR